VQGSEFESSPLIQSHDHHATLQEAEEVTLSTQLDPMEKKISHQVMTYIKIDSSWPA